jgi:transcription initiation factor TFIID subunit 11
LLVQGIRGIACCLVVIAHGFEGYAYPRDSFDARPYLFTLPIFKLVFEGGYLAVPIFFIMSGYVCAMKPMKLMRAGKIDDARKVVASSGFRRLIRLGIPATIAVTCSWFICQTGGLNMAISLPGDCWLHFHSAYPVEGFWNSVTQLVKAIVSPPPQTALLGCTC